MKSYLLLYTTPQSSREDMAKATPEQKAEGMKAWMEWNAKHGDNIQDLGAPSKPNQVLSQKEGWKEIKSKVSGYSIIQAKNLTHAKSILKNHPILNYPGSTLEVHDCLPMN